MKIPSTLAAAALILATGCAPGDSSGVLARAADQELTIDDAARLLAGAPAEIPNQPDVVQAIAELWTDYTLLAVAMSEDSTLSHIDLDELAMQQFEQEMIVALRDSVVQADTVVTEEELRELYDTQAPGARVRARHILLQYPLESSQAQRDSVRGEAEAVLARLQAGEAFEAVATEVSQDPGSAAQGGDLGFFGRGAMVAPFEEAAFGLEPGELSDVVESPFGLHIIRTEEKETPTFEEIREQFRTQLQGARMQAAESTYIASVEESAAMEIQEGAAELVRELAQDPNVSLGTRAGRRALVKYDGGEFTVGELLVFLRTRDPQFLAGLASGPDDAIEDNFLRGLTQRELLLAEAKAAGFEPPLEQRDSLTKVYRTNLIEAAAAIGVAQIEPRGTETSEQAIERTMEERLQGILAGVEQVIPLGAIAYVLRDHYRTQFYDGAVQATVDQVALVRAPAPAQLPAAPPPAPDTAG